MTDQEYDNLVETYLARLRAALQDAPADERAELVEDVRAHVEEAWAASGNHDRAALTGILDRLGQPEALARELWTPKPEPARPEVTAEAIAGGCGILIARAALVLLLFIGFGILVNFPPAAAAITVLSLVVAIWGYRHRRNLGWVLIPAVLAVLSMTVVVNSLTSHSGTEGAIQQGEFYQATPVATPFR